VTKSLANEYAADNIRVNTICIGLVRSAQIARRAKGDLETHYAELAKQRVPLGRVAHASEFDLEFTSEGELRRSLKEHVSKIVWSMQEQMEGLERCRGTRRGLGLLIAHLSMPAWNARSRMPAGVQYSAGTDIGLDGRGDGQRLWDLIDRTFTR
jgi:hypothetical protein